MSATLGLDLGPSSIGWALIDEESETIIAAGSRVFPEGVDNFDTKKEKSRNEDRRIARGMRRQIARRSRRKAMLREALVRCGLFPSDQDEQERLMGEDPYALRSRGVDPSTEPLTPHQIGRCLLHLNQRRGFLSNRKKDRGDKEVQGMLAEINDLAAAMGERTLGQYLAEQLAADPLNRIRGRHTLRTMLADEFNRLWETQAKHHPQLLTDALRYGEKGRAEVYPKIPEIGGPKRDWLKQYGLHGILFFQRKMYWPKSMVGLCELEPKEKRCPKADRLAQRFRLLQEVNNLRIIDPDRNVERELDEEERALLLDKLGEARDKTFDQIRKDLSFLESVRFNLEKGSRSKLWGLPVDHALSQRAAFGKVWGDIPDEQRNQIVRRLIDNDRDDDVIVDWLVSEYGLTEKQAEEVLKRADKFPAGYMNLSRKALEKLLPHMERGLVYQARDEQSSAIHAAGYLRRDELQRRIFDKLPLPDQLRGAKLGDIPNPVVRRTLIELRKVVNAIIREYGKPDEVHVEMAREVRQGEQARRDYSQRTREREIQRDGAAAKLRENNIRVNRDSINRYLVWEEQDHICVYSGHAISFAQLFSGEVDVDHILPYSRCLDDSQMNKVVSFRDANAEKGNRWPHQWLADSDPARYDAICQRARKLPYPKYRRFLQKELELDDFIARQLVDTGYIARATAEYLRCLFDAPHHVLGLKGQLTAELRWQWGLNGVLRHDDLDLKNREDHRHHALDAIVIALTDRRRLQQLSRIQKQGGTATTGEILLEPWKDFRDDVERAVNAINVSHRVQRKVAGALHEDTFYGPTEQPGEFVVRKPVASLSANEIEKIVDPVVRRVVIDRLAEHGIEIGRGKKPPRDKWMKALADPESPLRMPTKNGQPGPEIRKVRTVRKEQTIQPIREGRPDEAWVKPGSTHHLCIFEWKDERGRIKREAVFVTMLEATNRIKNKQPLIDRNPPKNHEAIPPDASFVMSLSRGEIVLANWKGEQKLLTLKTASSTQGQIWFAEHTDARKSSEYKQRVANANTLDARKVTIDPLGRVRWAND